MSLPVIETDEEMRYWLYAERMADLDEYIRFIGIDGTIRWSSPETFDVFKRSGDWFEIQGYDAPRKRWWVERVEPPPRSEVTPSGKAIDPRRAAA